VDGSGANRHFHNLAFWFGRRYHGLAVDNPINIAELKDAVLSAIRGTDTNKY
jgi:hypothetical protein